MLKIEPQPSRLMQPPGTQSLFGRITRIERKHGPRLDLQLILHRLEHFIGLIHVGVLHVLQAGLLEIRRPGPEVSLDVAVVRITISGA